MCANAACGFVTMRDPNGAGNVAVHALVRGLKRFVALVGDSDFSRDVSGYCPHAVVPALHALHAAARTP